MKNLKVKRTHSGKEKSEETRYEVNFNPELNGTYKVQFDEDVLQAGFTVLLKGGLFHRFPDGFIITRKHLQLLENERIPFNMVKRQPK